MNGWRDCKNILCVRPDNMGDVLMSTPAIAALKETFGCSITLLTSSMGKNIAPYVPAVDETIIWDVPWVKGTAEVTSEDFSNIIEVLKGKKFDAAVLFTVFSQNPLPAALMVTLAGIPNRLGYCRENPYHLLSHWVPEPEPYRFIRHQVRRDLELVKTVGATTRNERITLRLPLNYEEKVKERLTSAGVDPLQPWLIVHPGVSEKKREYPADLWIETGKKIFSELGYQVLITGAEKERALAETIRLGVGSGAYNLAGDLSLEEFITLIRFSSLLISVNTSSVHIAAAVNTKTIVLYALTNPQHTPWKAVGKLLPFSVPEGLESKNEVLRYVQRNYFNHGVLQVHPDQILEAAHDLLINRNEPLIEEMIGPSTPSDIASANKQSFKFQ